MLPRSWANNGFQFSKSCEITPRWSPLYSVLLVVLGLKEKFKMSKDYVTLGVQRESLINNPLLQKVTTTLHVLPLFCSYNRQELSGVIWGGGGVQQLASDKMVEILVQASNGQYPNKTSQSFLLRHAYYYFP